MKLTRKIVSINEERCNGCGECIRACAEGAIELADGKARLIAEHYCDGLAACLGECPQDAISIIEREAEAFDEEAVEHHLADRTQRDAGVPNSVSPPSACGCPSTQLKTFSASSAFGEQNVSGVKTHSPSALTHWPVQIKLVPPTAPFLKNANLLIASDCTAVAYPDFHEDLLKGRAVMMGCPKFDDTDEYISKMAEIFRVAAIKSVTIAIMEVPCCSKMPLIVQKGMEIAGAQVPTEIVVIGARGNILRRTSAAELGDTSQKPSQQCQ